MQPMDFCFRQAWRPDISGNITIFDGDEPVASDFDRRLNGKNKNKGSQVQIPLDLIDLDQGRWLPESLNGGKMER